MDVPGKGAGGGAAGADREEGDLYAPIRLEGESGIAFDLHDETWTCVCLQGTAHGPLTLETNLYARIIKRHDGVRRSTMARSL